MHKQPKPSIISHHHKEFALTLVHTLVLLALALLAPATCTQAAEDQTAPLTASEWQDIIGNFSKGLESLKQASGQAQEISDLKRKAAAGDSAAQCRLGFKYLNLKGEEFLRRDITEALDWLQKAGAQGNGRAQYYLGKLYSAESDQQDIPKAIDFFRRGTTNGDSWAQGALGYCYQHGVGVKKDCSEAFNFYMKSANSGNPDAQTRLGLLYSVGYYAGLEVSKDSAQGEKWLTLASDQGFVFAQSSLGELCFERTNYVQAAKLWASAASKGSSSSQYGLAKLFFNGHGVPKDYAEAYKWALVAKAHGEGTASKLLRSIEKAKGVNKETLAEGRNRAKNFGKRELSIIPDPD